MQKILLVALGGAIGSSFRYLLSLFLMFEEHVFIWKTFAVNIIGSLLIGLFIGFFTNNNWSENLSIFLIIGILGGFTTFSSFALDAVNLFKIGELKTALIYILATNILGIISVFIGFYLYKQLFTNII